MPQIGRILCPIDFSDVHKDIVAFALSLAKPLHSVVHFLYAIPDLDVHLPFGVHEDDVMRITSELAAKAEEKMKALVGSMDTDAQVEGSVVYGYPAEAIVGMVQQLKCDIIVMGTHGRTGIDRVVFGSVADQVLKNALVPVVTVRPKQ